MKTNIRLFTLIFLFASLPSVRIIAQSNDCALYEEILVYLNNKIGKVKYTDTGKIDPTGHEPPHTVRLANKMQYYFQINPDQNELNSKHIPFLTFVFEDQSLKARTYYNGEIRETDCKFNPTIKYTIQKPSETLSDKDFYVFTGKNNKSQVDYVPAQITFSTVLYSGQDLAIVSATMLVGKNSTKDEYIHRFIFTKSKSGWRVKTYKVDNRF